MSRCECGRPLAMASIQPHQKNSAVFVVVCSKSLLPPPDCTELTLVSLRRIARDPDAYRVSVPEITLGVVGVLPIQPPTWYWALSEVAVSGRSPTRDDAVRQILRSTAK